MVKVYEAIVAENLNIAGVNFPVMQEKKWILHQDSKCEVNVVQRVL